MYVCECVFVINECVWKIFFFGIDGKVVFNDY